MVRASLSILLVMTATCRPVRGQTDEGPVRSAVSTEAMATTANPLATETAMEMLRRGGNAVDAAVAAAFTLGVVEPDASGPGGGGGMVIFLATERKGYYINYYQQASEKVKEVAYDPRTDSRTAKAILIPGTVAGLTLALEKFGTLPLATVIAPAIRYADEGFPIDEILSQIILDNVELLQKDSATASIYLRDGFPLVQGDTLRQPELAMTLRWIAAEGRDGFYDGAVAERIVREVVRGGGMITRDDLRNYQARMVEPVRGTYRGYEILSANAPQSGASVIETLNILENDNLHALGYYADSVGSMHLIAEALRRAYADRTAYVGDPTFDRVPLEELTSKQFARLRFQNIRRDAVVPAEYRKTQPGSIRGYGEDAKGDVPDQAKEGGHTTHLSVMDKQGNAVSLTQTLGSFFGSGVTIAGVMMNQSMVNFSRRGVVNKVEPNKQPRSSISPTILLGDGKPFMVVGSPGATRILSTVVELILNVVDYGKSAEEANDAPRFLCQKNDDFLSLESRIAPSVQEGLRAKGHTLKVYGDYDLFFGGAQLIVVDQRTRTYHGSADPRRGGVAGGE